MSENGPEGIAIIGMAGRFPGAAGVEEFWRNLVGGVESISTFSEEELAASGLDVAKLRRDPSYVPARGIIEGAEYFDAPFFGMTAKEAEVTDPQQRLFLETCWHALENAGYDPDRAQGLIGVYCGVGINTYQHQQVRTRPDIVDLVGEELIILGNEKDYLATRIAYKLNLHGPALNVNTACSTALVAVGQACQALLNFQCDLALAGGVSVTFPQKRGASHQDGGFASPDGHTRAFDAQARGTVFSDGLGVVALKRLAEAIEDGDQIIAVVKGVGLNNDGSAKVGFTAPSVDGQAEAIALAQADAGVDPDSISYVECHGTATPIGDPIEIAALTQAFRLRTKRKNFCAIGSVKSNIGHLGAAAGAAGLIKTALALKNKVLPPSLHYGAPNPKIDFASSPFFVNTKLTDWKSGTTARRAGISAFGFGGTNAHVVLEEAPEVEPSSESREWKLLLLSAKSPAALDAATANLAAHLKAQPEANLADAAYTLQVGRRIFEHRRIVAVRDAADAAEALEKRDAKRVFTQEHDKNSDAPSVVFMFPGQGSQYVGMGADLYRTEPLFKEYVDRCAEILLPALGLDLREVLYPSPEKAQAAEELLIQTRITQPALFVIEYALAQLWMSWGIKPAALTGHSLGEYVAACLGGVFTLEDALALVAQRGHLIQSLPRGSMMAVPMTEDELKKILPPTLSIAGINGPAQCVVSGPSAEIDAFLAKLTADGKTGRALHTSHAFHSAMMDSVLQPFADCVRRVKRGEPTIPFISNVTGTWISADDARDPQYWARHLRQGVRFADGVKELLKNKAAVFLEVGPGTTLGSLARFQAKKADNRAVLSSLRHAREEQPDLAAMLSAMGQLWMRGVTVDWEVYYSDEQRHRVALPGYAFQRERYWVERGAAQTPAALPAATPAPATVHKNPDVAEWFYLPSWKLSAPLASAQPSEKKQNWLIFADEVGLAASVAQQLAPIAENIVTVSAGKKFAAAPGGFVIDPTFASDYEKLLEKLERSGRMPQRIAHFWGVTASAPTPHSEAAAFPRERQLGFDSLLYLAQAIQKRDLSDVIQLNLVANHTQDITGEEPLSPGKGMAQAFAKVLSLEQQDIVCRNFDVAPGASDSEARKRLVAHLAAEFQAAPSDFVVAYRGDHRWSQTFEHVRLASPANPRLRERGVYLITGGLGKIGLILAAFLAKNFRARLILAGRNGLPPREAWKQWLTDHPAGDATSFRIGKVQALEEMDGEVIVLGVDVANKEQLEAGLDQARQKFGEINGVIHVAGVAGRRAASFVSEVTPEHVDMHFRAKVHGLLALDEIFRGAKLDFFLLTSSVATVLGALGAGAYSAANRFMDVFALSRRQSGDSAWITVDWDSWREERPNEFSTKSGAIVEFSLTPEEGAEAFRRILGADLPQLIVSTGALDDRLAQWAQPKTTEKAAPVSAAKQSPAEPEASTGAVPAQTEIESVLAGIWSGLLGASHVGANDNFYDLGGDSLLLMRVQVKVREAFGVNLSAAEMFQYPTIGALAARLALHVPTLAAKPPGSNEQPCACTATVEQCLPNICVVESTVEPAASKSTAIAIIGMAGRFPGAENVEQFWQNLVNGVDSTTFFSNEDLAEAGLDVAAIRADPHHIAARGILNKPDWFDAAFFNIGAREAEVTDPQQRVFLEGAWEALENAGYDPVRYKGEVGVFAGMANNSYFLQNLHSHPELLQQVGRIAMNIGNEKDFLATRTAYKLNLRGPAISINTACSTSLVAIGFACQSLLARQCDMALAGGVTVTFPQKRANFHQQGGIFSPDGVTRPFDAKAEGTFFSDGLGVVVLKRLADALRDGDQVHAVIRGVGINNDGSDKVGFTAPGVSGQAETISRAQAHAGISPDTISYIEAHGTATPLGDPIEIAALTKAFRSGTTRKNFCAIGSVKGNFGHCDAAAGVVGLIKTTLALKHKKLPASLHFDSPNPDIDFANSPFYVNAKLADWKSGSTPRRAGISSFGIGGTNAHVVLEEAPAPRPSAPSRKAQLLVFSARSAAALDAATTRFVAHLKANPEINLADAAYTLQVGRRVFKHRRMVVARDVADAIEALESLDPQRVITRQVEAKDCPVVFMFPGQGAQYVNMGADLYRSEPVFRAEIDRCAEMLIAPLGADIRKALYPEVGREREAEKLLVETRFSQPALFAVEYALARLWMSWGVRPESMLSHSLGEFVAACLAGVFTLEEALTLIAKRSRLVEEQPGGAMVAVRLAERELAALLPKTLSIAALNSPALCVFAGPFDATEKFEEQLKGKGVISRRLDSSHAFHSAMMDPVVGPFAAQMEDIHLKPPRIPYVSNITGRWVTPDEATDTKYWARHARETVRFVDAVGEVLKDSQRALLEVGPGRTLATFATQHPEKAANRLVMPSILPANDPDGPGSPDIVEMLNALGRLWLAGKLVDWSGFYAHEKRRRIPLPTYAFERKRFWIEPIRRDTVSGRTLLKAEPQGVAEGQEISEENMPNQTLTLPVAAPTRRAQLVESLQVLFSEISGLGVEELAPSVSFMELGFDSLSLAQASQVIERKFGAKVAFRQMLQELSTLDNLASYLEKDLPLNSASIFAPPAQTVPARPAATPPQQATSAAPSTLEAIQAQLLALSQQMEELRKTVAPQPASTVMTAPAAAPSAPTQAPRQRPGEPVGPIEIALSDSQKELWLTAQAGSDASRAFNQIFSLHLPGRLDEAALAGIVQQLIVRHDALRTTFAADGSVQVIAPSLQVEVPVRDLSLLGTAQQEKVLSDTAAEEAQFTFDLAQGPLLRARLFKLSGGRFTIIFNVHHIVLDGWSISVLIREFGWFYQACEQGTGSVFEPAMQNQDYVEWQNSPAHQPDVEKSEKYWLKQFSPVPNDIEIPADRPRPAIQTFHARQKRTVLDNRLYCSLKNSAAAHGCTLFAYLVTALNVWLYRLSGQEDLVIGIPSAGQLNVTGTPGNRLLVGHCVSMLPLRSRCSDDQTFADLLQAVKLSLLDAHEHQSLTIGSLVRQLHLPRDPSRPPLIPLVFNLGRSSRYLQLPDAHFTFLAKEYTFYDLNIEMSDSGNDLRVDCRYNTDLFDDARIDRMLQHLRTLLTAAAADTSRKISDLPLLTDAERRHIVADLNRTEVDYPKDRFIHQIIEDQAAATPDAVALAFEDKTLTYRELNARANQLARHLQKLGVVQDQLVGICIERSLEMVIGLLGIVKAGGAYVPIDPEYPKQRLTFMLEDSNVSILLTQAHLAESLPASASRLIRLDADWPMIARESDAPVESGVNAENLAYMIYTSGSTGRPKGAMNTHKGILNRLQWMQEAYQLTPADRVLQKTPFSFDVSVWEFFWPLMMGSRLVVARPGGHRDPTYLSQLIAREKITTLHFVPSMLQLFLAQDGLDKSCASLKRVVCSGEALPLELQRRFFAVLNAELHNLYGPTEAAVDVTYWACQRNTTLNTVPIGKPIANTQIYILDPKLQPVPIGLPGELHLGGVQLARGYHNRPELTAEKFIPDPFSSDPKARLYKTGDLARFFPDGNVEYLGRLDHQIKIRGLRIELGEIEEAINQFGGIETCVVIAREDTPGDVRLVAYTVNKDKAITTTQLRDYLHSRLPEYMVPAAFVTLDVMPLSPNGKVERKALPKPDFEAGADKNKYAPPTTQSQIAIEKIWSEVLGVKQSGIDDNFFELGGHSMLAVRILGRLKKQLDFNVPIPVFFQNPTVRKLAAVYDHERGENKTAVSDEASAEPDLITYQSKGTRTPFFYLHGDWGGDGLYCGYVTKALDAEQPFYVLPPYRFGKTKVFKLDEMVDHHLAVLRKHTPHGPYLLGGFCAGATVAIEMARRLLADGEKVEHLILVDPPRGDATLMTPLWHLFNLGGSVLGWDLRKKIFKYDKYGVSIGRWYNSSLRGKLQGIGRRLGLTKAGSENPNPVQHSDDGEPNVLVSLDYGLYVLAQCLHTIKPLPVPVTVYFPTETSYTSAREKWPKEVFASAKIEHIPGTHLTCISHYPEVLADKIGETLKQLNETNPNRSTKA